MPDEVVNEINRTHKAVSRGLLTEKQAETLFLQMVEEGKLTEEQAKLQVGKLTVEF